MDQQSTNAIPGIALFPVSSTRISMAGYDPESRILALQFKDNPNRTYRYQDVPAGIWDGFEKAESKGKYFYSAIFKQFGFTRIEADGEVSKIEPAPQIEQEPESATEHGGGAENPDEPRQEAA